MSVALQTYPCEHLVELDSEYTGPAATLNRLVFRATAAWLVLLADDDLLYPIHTQFLIEKAVATGADIVYSFADVIGQPPFPEKLLQPYDEQELRRINTIVGAPLIRRQLAVDLGGFDETRGPFCDWDFYLRALDAGAKIACVEQRTWLVRRLGDGNYSAGFRHPGQRA